MTFLVLLGVISLGLFFIPVLAQEQIEYTNTGTQTFDGFKITLETDKKIYNQGELVQIHTSVENILDEDLDYNVYGCGPALSIDEYDYSNIEPAIQEIFCTAEVRTLTLNASDSLDWKYSWNQLVDVGDSWEKISDGTHEITYGFDDYEISLEIETKSSIKPPLKQIENGVEPENVNCKEGLELVFKASDNSPACVRSESVSKLVERGWART